VNEVIVPYLGPPSSRRRDQKPAEPVPVTMPDPETLEQYEQSRKEQIIKILAEALADAMGKKDSVA